MLIGFGVVWGASKASLNGLRKSHSTLKDEFIRHKDNTKIHIDPDRDPAALHIMEGTIMKRFDSQDTILNTISQRCEDRGKECGHRFSSLDLKIAAQTGKANGD
jgi:hypothetical protein